MITLQLTPELWRFTLLLAILLFHKPAYRLLSRTMDRLKQTSSRSTSGSCSRPPAPSSEDHATSPRVSAFHRRFRSSASDSTSATRTAADPTEPALSCKSEAARSAKRFLSSTVRDDWQYPPSQSQTAPLLAHRRPVDYRVREEGSSEPEPLSDEPYDARDPMVFADSNPYKFENPDAVARTLSERKRRRCRLLQDELQWNQGLRNWTERRNMWCGAVDQERAERLPKHKLEAEKVGRLPGSANPSSSLSPHSQMSTISTAVDSSEEFDSNSDSEDEAGSLEGRGPLLPVFPALIPGENVIRASIKPSMHPAIYSKVVLQGLTPTVPVPLPDMIGALVQGWKAEGNWPSKGPALSGPITSGGRRASELLRFRRRDGTIVDTGRMRKGVGAVKKALRLRTPEGEAAKAGLNFENWEKPRPQAQAGPAFD